MNPLRLFLTGSLLKKSLILISSGLLIIIAVIGIDLSSYNRLTEQQTILQVSMSELEDGLFQVSIEQNQQKKSFLMKGDQWQIDFRLIRLQPLFYLLLPENLYQLTRLSNRYESDEDQLQAKRYVYSLKDNNNATDLWHLFKDNIEYIPFIQAMYGSAVFMPLLDGASYKVNIGFSGLVVIANNDKATRAIYQWQ